MPNKTFGVRVATGDRPISQSIKARALQRFEQAHEADSDLNLEAIEQDEATRRPLNARKERRTTAARRRKAQRRFDRMTTAQLVQAARTTPAPSRGARRTAARLTKETS